MENARLDLAVLLFPTLDENFSVVDDLDSPTALPTFDEIQAMASRDNPDIRVAIETMRQADLDVKTAKNAFLPTLTVETDYGIEANAIGLTRETGRVSRTWAGSNAWLLSDGRVKRARMGLGDAAKQGTPSRI